MVHRAATRSEEHTSELQSHSFISYAVFCLKKNTGREAHEGGTENLGDRATLARETQAHLQDGQLRDRARAQGRRGAAEWLFFYAVGVPGDPPPSPAGRSAD